MTAWNCSVPLPEAIVPLASRYQLTPSKLKIPAVTLAPVLISRPRCRVGADFPVGHRGCLRRGRSTGTRAARH